VWLADGPVVQVKFKQRTEDGSLRQPVFLRLRTDKQPHECAWPRAAAEHGDEALPEPAPPAAAAAEPHTVNLTNLDKVFWPAERYTKKD
jgi:bifunctional non-homologous end joining protein LigD